MKRILVLIIALVFASGANAQKFEGLAETPPMGWNSWNKFACDVDENLIKETADAMVASGMKDAGYEYIVIDDCWHGERDSLGFIHPDPERFPSGIKALADYIHSKGLKFGIYSDAGWETCGGRPGSRGREYQDAMTYASWGVDYLKYDWCNTEGLKAEGAYLTMRDALYEAGRPIVFSICEWGDNDPWEWAGPIGHLWRTTGDIYNCFDCEEDHGTWSSWGVLQIIDMRPGIRTAAGPGHWNDPDMMEVGNGMSVSEDRAHFALWAIQAAPLIAGNDIRNMSPETVEILTNKDVIAIDQDTLGVQGYKHIDEEDYEVWVKPLAGGEVAVLFLNRTEDPMDITFDWKANKMTDPDFGHSYDYAADQYSIYNVHTHKKSGTTKKALKATIPGHDVLMYRLTKK
ncbi:glycoside hydrolase family 27 protein [Reichenbachiella ulvae]|uniref:Alpha-galactosidase n=1 Tax=Reichenbachiella ulvae TaxID=2980104 RepID=A0ABT3CTY2_9BACT|nr:glycoside hydrolase family 27 protein [Reichenbachiella ulvae]MCV9387004.1 glycoside hydrolase family 27 protein [Reichenbachiella ulvae]